VVLSDGRVVVVLSDGRVVYCRVQSVEVEYCVLLSRPRLWSLDNYGCRFVISVLAGVG